MWIGKSICFFWTLMEWIGLIHGSVSDNQFIILQTVTEFLVKNYVIFVKNLIYSLFNYIHPIGGTWNVVKSILSVRMRRFNEIFNKSDCGGSKFKKNILTFFLVIVRRYVCAHWYIDGSIINKHSFVKMYSGALLAEMKKQ